MVPQTCCASLSPYLALCPPGRALYLPPPLPCPLPSRKSAAPIADVGEVPKGQQCNVRQQSTRGQDLRAGGGGRNGARRAVGGAVHTRPGPEGRERGEGGGMAQGGQ